MPVVTPVQPGAHTIAWYGATGARKTTQIGEFALYVYETTGRRTRLVSAEMGSTMDILDAYIKRGIIEVLWLAKANNPKSLIKKLVRGFWLQPVNEAGERVMDLVKAARVVPMPPIAGDFEQVGGYCFEGLSSIAGMILADTADKNIPKAEDLAIMAATAGDRNQRLGKTGMAGYGYIEDDEIHSAPSQPQYGSVQKDILQMMQEAPKTLYAVSRGRVQYVAFTGHESKGMDKDVPGGQTVFGPAVVGQAATPKVAREVGTLLHFDEITKRERGEDGQERLLSAVVAWFERHPDVDLPTVLWDAKARVAPSCEAYRRLKEKWPKGYFLVSKERGSGIREFLKFQDELQGYAADALDRELAEIEARRTQKEKTE